jgi:DNA topoisomerase-3
LTIVVIAEKPSVARDLAKVLGARTKGDGYLEGQGYRVGWCIGHLLELAPPESYDPAWKRWSQATLPMLPERFQLQPRKGATKQLAILKSLLRERDVTRIVNACDAGREGELIFRWLIDYVFGHASGAGSATRRPPIDRLWIASLTDASIAAGFARLKPGAAYDPLADAARCRSEADWLVGLNATRAMTLLGRRAGADRALLSVGRVQTPTLAMLTRREDQIEAFVPEPFWHVDATFVGAGADQNPYVGRWFDPRPTKTSADQDTDRSQPNDRLSGPDASARAGAIANAVAEQPARIAKVTREEQREQAPALFDLTSLQKLANQRFGLSADRTLKAAQNLYEQHKAITYPRTDSRFVTADVGPTLPALLRAQTGLPWASAAQTAMALGPTPQRRIVDDTEVGDHHAILPTERIPDLGRLSFDERHVYELVARRLVAVFLPAAIFDKRTIITTVAGTQSTHHFRTEGRARVALGWHAAEPPPPARDAAPLIPAVIEGEAAHTLSAKVIESKTQPPKRFTEATLLGAMENAGKDLTEDALRRAMRESGLGTPATRASIIETLLTRDFIRRDGKSLNPTPSGRALIAALPVPALCSAELTGAWEARLSRMAEGRDDPASFMAEIRRFTTEAIAAMASATPPRALEVSNTAEALGRCPVCGTAVTQGRKAYSCASGRECTFVIFTTIAGKTISPNLVKLLLGKRRSSVLPGFRSKAGKRFKAALVLGPDGQVSLDFGGSSTHPESSTSDGEAPKARRRTASTTTGTATRTTPKSARAAPSPKVPKPAKAPKEPRDERPRCPRCKEGRVMEGRQAWGCTRWREGCGFVVTFQQGGIRLPDEEADRLFRRGQTRLIAGLSAERPARLILDLGAPGNVVTELGKRRRA